MPTKPKSRAKKGTKSKKATIRFEVTGSIGQLLVFAIGLREFAERTGMKIVQKDEVPNEK